MEKREQRRLDQSELDRLLEMNVKELKDLDISKLSLRGKDITGFLIENTDMSRTDMRDVTAERVVIKNSSLKKSMMTGSNIEHGTIINTDMTSVTMDDAKSKALSLQNCDITGSSYKNTTLTDSRIINCEARNDDFEARTTFENAKMYNMLIEESKLEAIDIIQSGISGTYIENTRLNNIKIDGTEANSVTAKNINIRSSQIMDTMMNDATIVASNIETTTSFQCDMDRLHISRSTINKNKIIGALVGDNCVIDDVKIQNSSIENSLVDAMDMDFGKLTGATVKNSNFINPNIRDSNIYKSTISNTVVRNATVVESDVMGTIVTSCDMPSLKNNHVTFLKSTFAATNMESSSTQNVKMQGMMFIADNMDGSDIRNTGMVDIYWSDVSTKRMTVSDSDLDLVPFDDTAINPQTNVPTCHAEQKPHDMAIMDKKEDYILRYACGPRDSIYEAIDDSIKNAKLIKWADRINEQIADYMNNDCSSNPWERASINKYLNDCCAHDVNYNIEKGLDIMRKTGIPLDFEGIDLSHMTLDMDMSDCNFAMSNLSGSVINGYVDHTNMDYTNLDGTQIKKSQTHKIPASFQDIVDKDETNQKAMLEDAGYNGYDSL